MNNKTITDPVAKISSLVERFRDEEEKLTIGSSSYTETEARVEYIDPFFEVLGWDMNNSNGISNTMKDVVREESQPTESSAKRPDYTFRISGHRKFFVEAKRPSVDIRLNRDSAFQIRSYGWTASHSIAILTNFRTLRVYDTRTPPTSGDNADVGLLLSIDYDKLPSYLDDLVVKFSRETVASGSIEQHFGETVTGTLPINDVFLERINNWRLRLAKDLRSRYAELSINNLNDITQKVINRIIFIRMCEDRGIEGEQRLREVALQKNFIEIRVLFRKLDDRYNTGLFDVREDRLQDMYTIDAQLFLDIIDEVYFPQSPYSFSVLDADFLGQVYEEYLVKRLEIDEQGNLVLKDKPAYENREVITTPQPLVNEVVRRALSGKLCELEKTDALTFEKVKELQILDIAVGSGRFLLRVLDELVDASIKAFQNSGDLNSIYRISDTNYRLSFEVKRELLHSCLYGIDIDYNAVEVARFSLMVKLLEDENSQTLPEGQKILPNLDENIVWGNSVVDQDFPITSGPVYELTRPLDWSSTTLPEKFDVVVGNPPYVKTEEMLGKTPDEMEYYKQRYSTPFKQFDKYFVFIERAIEKMEEGACFGMVVKNKWITIESGKKLRGLLAEHHLVSDIVDFGNELVFEGRSTYVCLLVLGRQERENISYRYVRDYHEFQNNPQNNGELLPIKILENYGSDSWILPSNGDEALVLTSLMVNAKKLREICNVPNGIQTSADDVFAIKDYEEEQEVLRFENDGRKWEIEKNITRPYLMDSSRISSYLPVVADARVIYPYEVSDTGALVPIQPTKIECTFPKAWVYLNAYKERLQERDVQPNPPPNVFYAYGRHQALETAFRDQKIIYTTNQRGDKYGIDRNGVGFASGGTAGEVAIVNPQYGYELEFILGMLNQRPMELFLRKRGSPQRGGYYSRGSGVISDAPVPWLNLSKEEDKKRHDDIISIVRRLILIQGEFAGAIGRRNAVLRREKVSKTNLLKQKFDDLWGFSGEVDNLVLPGES